MEERVSGFRVTGDWPAIVEHGERVTRALRDLDVNGDSPYAADFEEWEEWRPKAHERIEEDVPEKTAEQASVGEGEGEKAGSTPGEDVKTAGDKLSESYEKLEDDGDAAGAREAWGESIDYVARAADSAGRKALRVVEDTVYQRVMTQLAPYYFDNALISANLQQSGRDDDTFVFEVNVNDDELKSEVGDRLRDYEDEVDRWHVDTEKETAHVEAAEGVETPTENENGRSKHTTN
ncbi:hypothetical protein L593_07225 [Salinarchaeum sp. Harcht-Bsk1]|uniref:DUF5828 family protein n=1 Tax=Salinarchaeum sp. Harcht-Bsk1 TaxID=1333523 RepID=UPI00034249AB|nr:DUF5828 family protein [Salinarchaeum sp. Harcht-Bsk1]AGN01392.1 hypothetical protein L593_07225 [Salinarchaeum sp. Harcht-Bsk1]